MTERVRILGHKFKFILGHASFFPLAVSPMLELDCCCYALDKNTTNQMASVLSLSLFHVCLLVIPLFFYLQELYPIFRSFSLITSPPRQRFQVYVFPPHPFFFFHWKQLQTGRCLLLFRKGKDHPIIFVSHWGVRLHFCQDQHYVRVVCISS